MIDKVQVFLCQGCDMSFVEKAIQPNAVLIWKLGVKNVPDSQKDAAWCLVALLVTFWC